MSKNKQIARLKPNKCPNCGSENVYLGAYAKANGKNKKDYVMYLYITCNDCKTDGPEKVATKDACDRADKGDENDFIKSRNEATTAWNDITPKRKKNSKKN